MDLMARFQLRRNSSVSNPIKMEKLEEFKISINTSKKQLQLNNISVASSLWAFFQRRHCFPVKVARSLQDFHEGSIFQG